MKSKTETIIVTDDGVTREFKVGQEEAKLVIKLLELFGSTLGRYLKGFTITNLTVGGTTDGTFSRPVELRKLEERGPLSSDDLSS